MSEREPDLAAPAGALELIAQGINKAHEELKDLGMIGEATTGRGFSDLSLSGVQLGHDGLSAEFTMFCERWEWGVRALMNRGNGFAQALGLSAGSVHEQEQYIKGTFKIAVNAVNGNPHLSEDEVTGKSWDEISAQTPQDKADYSAESFTRAQSEVEQTWRDTGYDVSDGVYDSMRNSGVITPEGRELMEEKARETFDPSEEAVRQAEQPNWGDR